MPQPFKPVAIPLVSGVRQDVGTYVPGPENFREAENVVFTKRGSVRGRPGVVTKEAQVQVAGAGTALTSTVASVVSGFTPAGIVAANGGGAPGRESPLLLYQGKALSFNDTVWRTVGFPWSVKATRSTGIGNLSADPNNARQNAAPCGTNVVGVLAGQHTNTGYPFFNSRGEVSYLGTGGPISVVTANVSAAGNALVFTTTEGDVRMLVPGTLPVTTNVNIGSNADTTATYRQNIWAVTGESGSYYVAYKSATAGRIILKRVDSAGTVTATQNVDGLGTVWGVSIVFDGTDKLALYYLNLAAGPDLISKVFTTTSSTFTDAAIDITETTAAVNPNTGPAYGSFAAGISANGKAVVVYTGGGDYGVRVSGRTFTTTSTAYSNVFTLYGTAGGEVIWEPLFGAVVLAGRTLIGVTQSMHVAPITSCQWFVLDVDEAFASSSVQRPILVAKGTAGSSDRVFPGTVGKPTSTSIAFGVAEATRFSDTTITGSTFTRIELALQAASACQGHGLTVLSGCGAQSFDGAQLESHGFPETYPWITAGSVGAGGSLAAGSYSYQVTWEAVNARNQVILSGASEVKTMTAALNEKSTLTVTVPQLRGYYTDLDKVRVRLWATQVNPSGGAPLYFVTENVISAQPTSATTSLIHSVAVVTTNEQLYTGDGVLDAEPAPAGDRGVAYVNERLWVADQYRVYASRLLKQGYAPSWNTEGLHTVTVPSSLGQIQGIAGVDDKLTVHCDGGVFVVFGAGVDDLGNGPGWTGQIASSIPASAVSGPRGSLSTPMGAVFLGADGDVYLVTRGMEVQCISRAVRDLALASADLAWVPSNYTVSGGIALQTNDLLVAPGQTVGGTSATRVLDASVGAWASWTLADLLYVAGVSGVLWTQNSTSPPVRAVDGYSLTDLGKDLGTNFTQKVTSGTLAVSGPAQGWGRVRGAVMTYSPLVSGTSVSERCLIKDDISQTNLCDSTATLDHAATATWPHYNTSEHRCSLQRARGVQVTYTAVPGNVEWSALELWVSDTSEQAPSKNRV